MNVLIVCMALAVGIVSADTYTASHPQSGEWSNWGPWMGCSATCGGGRDTRMRTCHAAGGTTGSLDLTTLLLLSGGLGGDSSSSLDSLLLPLLLGGGTGGTSGGLENMNLITLLTLFGGIGGDSTDSSSTLDTLLPLLLGGQDIDPSLLLLLSGGLGSSNSTFDPLMLLLLQGMGGQTETQKHCYGSRMETRMCHQHACPAPVNCLSQWSQWGDCSNGCGAGTKIRSRTCNCHDARPGYNRCNGAQLYEQHQCSSYDACPVIPETPITPTGQWGEWSAYSDCMVSGSGCYKKRTRTCPGNMCEGSFEQSIECTGGSCPYSPNPVVMVGAHCKVEANERQECGYAGISRDACLQNNCCYDDSIAGTYWCFKHYNA